MASRKQSYLLFLCHFLSTWNARAYEFSATLFTAAAYPQGLRAASMIGISTSVAVILFASTLGNWVDRSPSRLQTLQATISTNRCVAIGACICWLFVLSAASPAEAESPPTGLVSHSTSHRWRDIFFSAVVVLGIAERLSRLANLLSIERDWVPTLCLPVPGSSFETRYNLTYLNAVMSRIDLICKLGSPILMSLLMSRSSTTVGVFLVLATNVLTWPLELWTARRVWDANSNLRKSRGTSQGAVVTETSDLSHHGQGQQASSVGLRMKASALTCFSSSCAWLIEYRISLQEYFTTDIYLPSLATSGLHFSILNYSSTFTVFLLNSHFSLTFITLAETLSAFFELASTFLFPWAVHTLSLSKQHYARVPDGSALSTAIPLSPTGHLRSIPSSPVDARFPSGSRGPSTSNDEQELERAEDPDPSANISSGLSRLGLLALLQMLLSLLPALPALWHLSTNLPPQPPTPTQSSPWHTHPLPTTLLLLCVSASRFGRWTTVLSTQQLAQTLVPARQRSSFAGTEAGFASLFGLAHWLATAVWSQRRDFRWLALGSVGGVVGSTCVWGYWLGRRRVEGRG